MAKRVQKIGVIGVISLIGLMGGVHAQATLSADTIVLGDTTVLTVKGDSLSVGGELIEILKEERNEKSGMCSFWLTSYDPGVRYVKWGEKDSLRLVVLGVDVDPKSDEIKENADIEGIVNWAGIEKKESNHWFVIALIAGILAVAGLLFWWWRRRSHTPIPAPKIAKKLLTAEERALERLENLRRSQLWQSGRIKEYYTELTDTLRVFIEEVTAIRATEMTSEECVNALMCKCASADASILTQSRVNALTHSLLDIFTTADLVKFAKEEPLPNVHQKVYEEAVEFVKGMWESVNGNNGDNENDGNNE